MVTKIRRPLRIAALCVAATLTVPLGSGSLASTQTVNTRIGALDFENGYPSNKTVARLYDELDFQRAVQAYIWSLPTFHLWASSMRMKNPLALATWTSWSTVPIQTNSD
jgi:hypothetical protein